MPRPIHLEIPADNPDRAIKFYEGAFGWKFQLWPGPEKYWLFRIRRRQGAGDQWRTARAESHDAETGNDT